MRSALLERARSLARSGEHDDADAIMAAMQDMDGVEDVRDWFEGQAFRHQLNCLCTLAQMSKPVPRGPRGARRRLTRAG